MKLFVKSYGSLTQEGLFKAGKGVRRNDAEDFNIFAKQIYREHKIDYPKYFKMDELCKLTFLLAETVLDGEIDENLAKDRVGLILANKSSSKVSDQRHHKEMNGLPSPGVFVYTLPNIMLGELCIRHKFMGENSCFIMDQLQSDFICDYVHDLFSDEQYEACLVGWVDYDIDNYFAHLLWVGKTPANEGEPLEFERNFDQLFLV